jgi:uncharacterized Zn-binding protein involved in type VI secretion
MKERLVAKGDLTSAGGHVIHGSSTQYDDNGRRLALDLDQVNCPGGKNRVFARPKAGYSIATKRSHFAGEAIASGAVDRTAYDQSFVLRDERSKMPLAGFLNWIVSEDGSSSEDRTDAQGRTIKISSAQAASFTLHVLEVFTAINPGWDKDL